MTQISTGVTPSAMVPKLENDLESTLIQYQQAFSSKTYSEENNDHDLLMDVFGITPELKRENRQYWGRELGMCWQVLVTELCKQTCGNYSPPLRFGLDEPFDLGVGNIAIDTKYRIGSGDSGTLKKFKEYGPLIKNNGMEPVLLILRTDNLPAAKTACIAGGWKVIEGEDSFNYLKQLTTIDFKEFLKTRVGKFSVDR